VSDTHPVRSTLAALRARTADAVDELAGLRDHDPAAADAVHAVKLAQATLERFWLPALDRLAAGRTD
jgi:hypothetical protein